MDDSQRYELGRIKEEIADSFDEELEMQMEEDRLDELVAEGMSGRPSRRSTARSISANCSGCSTNWCGCRTGCSIRSSRCVVIFEGRDSAGKGGAIKRVTQRLNPRVCRVVALPAPTEREKNQWYFQRYVPHLPAAGEMVLFDRSWYNRAGVERVMGFCTQGRTRGVLPLGARVRAHAGALRHHPDQILVLDHRRGAAVPLQDAHPRSAEAVEAVADGHGKPRPLGRLHQGQGRDAGAHAYRRTRPGGWCRPSTRSGRGSTASRICSSRSPMATCRSRRSNCRRGCTMTTMCATRCRPRCTCRSATEGSGGQAAAFLARRALIEATSARGVAANSVFV